MSPEENSLSVVIPARSGSKRVPGKNLRLVDGQPLLKIAIDKARKVVSDQNVYVSTDSLELADLARGWGAKVPKLRPEKYAEDMSIDYLWVEDAILGWPIQTEYFAILRTTSPLTQSDSILRAFKKLQRYSGYDSIRAIRRVAEHPGKMWRLVGNEAIPLLPQIVGDTPSHSRPTQSLEQIYVQCGAFEVAKTSSVLQSRSIHGGRVLGYVLESPEDLDINSELDLSAASLLLEKGSYEIH